MSNEGLIIENVDQPLIPLAVFLKIVIEFLPYVISSKCTFVQCSARALKQAVTIILFDKGPF